MAHRSGYTGGTSNLKTIITVDVEGNLGRDGYESVDVFDEFESRVNQGLTLFVTPDVVQNRPELVRGWAAEGHTIGLHIHPERFTGGSVHLTDYNQKQIEALLEEGKSVFENYLSQVPKYFRAGRWEYSEALLRALDRHGFAGDASLVPKSQMSRFRKHGVAEFPLTSYQNPLTPLLLRPWGTRSIPLYADMFLAKYWKVPGFYIVTWRVLCSDREYMMTAFHDYDLRRSSVRERIGRYIEFLSDRTQVVPLCEYHDGRDVSTGDG